MNRYGYELADVIQRFLPGLSKHRGISSWQLKVLNALLKCRTSALGGHKDICEDCGQVSYSYNSCRNRHCPKCQGTDREKWILAREADLLPIKYFHVVFTLPEALNKLCMFHPKDLYNILFRTVWDVLKSFAADPKWLGGQLGATAILHTWSQTMGYHPHVHLIVPAGGIIDNRKWKSSRNRGKFLFRVEHLSSVFRARFVAELKIWAKHKTITLRKSLLDKLFEKDWVVYAKQPFAGPGQVIEYMGRYTHRVAISNNRIKQITGKKVTFSYINRQDNNTKKDMSLDGEEFLRRFIMHILPYAFTRIRHYGFLASKNKTKTLDKIRHILKVKAPEKKKLSWVEIATERWGFNPMICKSCGGKMVISRIIPKQRAPPMQLWGNRDAILRRFEMIG